MEKSALSTALAVAGCYVLLSGGWVAGAYALTGTFCVPGDAARCELVRGAGLVGITAIVLMSVLLWKRRPGPTQVTFGEIAEEFHQSIRRGEHALRWLPAGAAVLLLLLLGLLLLGLWSVRERTLEAGEQTIGALRYGAASQIGAKLTSINDALDGVVQNLDHGLPVGERPGLKFAQSNGRLLRATWVIDLGGWVVLESDLGNLGLDRSARDNALHHQDMASSGFFVGDPVRSPATGTLFVLAGVPYRTPDGALLGFVVAAVELSRFSTIWDNAVDYRGLVITLLRDDGTVLARSPFNQFDLGPPFCRSGRMASSDAPLRIGCLPGGE